MAGRDKEVQKKLESIGEAIYRQIDKSQNPTYEVPVRTLNNVFFDKKSGTIKLGDKVSEKHYLAYAPLSKQTSRLSVSRLRKLYPEENRRNEATG